MLNLRWQWMLSTVLVAALTIPACQPLPSGGVPTSRELSLWVTDGERPLTGARIVLLPVQLRDQAGRLIPLAFGTTDDQGRCLLATTQGIKRLTTGTYQVLITKPRAKPGQPPMWASALIGAPQARGESRQMAAPPWLPDLGDEVSPYFGRESTLQVTIEPGATRQEVKLDLGVSSQ